MATDSDQLPETLQEAITYFADPDCALAFMVGMRWPEGVACPYCAGAQVSFLRSRRIWKCMDCRKQFSVKIGTVMEDSPLSLSVWICGFWMITNAKNGVSSHEIHRALGITQKSAWFLLHRIRLALQNGGLMRVGGAGQAVEVDETFIGGQSRFKHKARKAKGTGPVDMTPVLGLLERTNKDRVSRVILEPLETTRKSELQGHVRKYVIKGAAVYTDALKSYNGLESDYRHEFVDHADTYVRGAVHTNGMENFWSLLKRAIKGTYISVMPFHLFRYLDEQAFRFNERKNEDGDRGRFLKAIAGYLGKRLTYKKLIGKDETPLLGAVTA